MTQRLHAPKRRYPTFQEYLKAEYSGPLNATDAIIRHATPEKSGLVIIKRGNYPWGYASAGGIAEDITFQRNAVKECSEELDLTFIIDHASLYRPFVLYKKGQDPRAKIACIAYTGTGYGTLRAGDDAKYAAVYTLDEIADMLFLPVADKEKQEQKDVWATQHHKTLFALYLLEQHRPYTRRQEENLRSIIDAYTADIEEDIAEEMAMQRGIHAGGAA